MNEGAPGPAQIVAAGLCVGCGSCMAQDDNARTRMRWNRDGYLQPQVAAPSPADFDRICPFAPGARNEDELASSQFAAALHNDRCIGRFRSAYVGHVEEGDFRQRGSSGGMVSWMAAELLRRQLVDGVAHVVPCDRRAEGRLFRYTISRTIPDVRAGACSRYYPVDLSEVLQTIRSTPGRYAIVGIPCFIKAVNLLRAENDLFRQRIAYTLGLFCGHMKSARFVESIALQMGLDPDSVTGVQYRVKTPGRPASWYRARLVLADGSAHERDWWDLADGDWGAGYFQNPACNFCSDVVAETADIAFGDAWVEPCSSDGRGTNVIIVRDAELDELVTAALGEDRLSLRKVGPEFIRQTQAAGLRHRREGLAYRLAWKPPPFVVGKRNFETRAPIRTRRKLIYRTRYAISLWGGRMFHLARVARSPKLYVWWARMALHLYQGLTYSRGATGWLFDMVLRPGSR